LERIKDWLLMEEEFVQNQEVLKPQEEKAQEERAKVEDLRGSPMGVGTLEERIDENHAIVGSSVGPEYYVTILSFVDKDLLEPSCSVLLHNKVRKKFVLSIFPSMDGWMRETFPATHCAEPPLSSGFVCGGHPL